jgi:FkbM family methyltransferase
MKTMARNIYGSIVRIATGYGLDRIAPIHNAHNAMLRRLRPESVTVFEMQLFLDKHDSLNLSIDQEHEPVLTEFCRAVIPRGGNAIDVGAHIGYFSLLLADIVGESGHVTSFEAHPDNAASLKRSIDTNNLKQVTVIHNAVSDKVGTVPISVSTADSVDHRIFAVGDRDTVDVPCTSLDKAIAPGTTIDFIKMDIQGVEGYAVEGMRRLISEQDNLIIVSEFEPWGLNESGYRAKKYANLLVSLGFRLYDLNDDTGDLRETSPKELEVTYPAIKDQFTTLVAEISEPDQSRLTNYIEKKL